MAVITKWSDRITEVAAQRGSTVVVFVFEALFKSEAPYVHGVTSDLLK